MTQSLAPTRGTDDAEDQVLAAFGGDDQSTVVHIIDEASKHVSSARVRGAYWALITRGVIVTDSLGNVRRNHP